MATDGAEQPKSTGEPVERARAGIRGWVRAAGRRTGAGLRAASPYAILAFLTASAVAPVAAVGLGAGEFAAVLNQLGNVGGNYLADVLAATVGRMREGGPVSEQRWRDEVAGALAPLLAAGDEQSRELRAEVGRLLRGVDAVGTALAASAEADDALRDELAAAFQALGAGVGELHWMLVDTRIALDGLQQQLAIQSLALHQQLDVVRQHLVTFAQLRHTPVVPGPPGALALPGDRPCPYPGLASFQPEDAPWFRGREEYVARLLGRLAEHAVGGPPLVLTGVSGVGKSSLLRAGLLPAIAAGGLGEAATGWPWLLMTPGSAPLAELVPRLEALAGAAAEPSTVELVRTGPERLGRLAARAAARGHRPVLVVDQFEELFTQCPDRDEQLAFAAALAGAGPALVVIAVRADFYAACTQLPPLAEVLSAGHVVLDALDTAALHRAVVEPAARAGLTVEPGLPDLLLRDLGAAGVAGAGGYQPGALPLLAHALRATWDRREGDRLTVAGYRATGGIHHAVAETAEEIYLALGPDDRTRLRGALLGLVAIAATGVVVRRRGERASIDPQVLDRLVSARLVTADRDTVEVSHEALLTHWPRLAGWLVEARADILLRQRLADAAEDWDGSGRDPDLLLRGSRLAAARESVAGGGGLGGVPGDYLAASVAAADAAEEARRRAARRLRALAAGLAVALLLAVAGGLVALKGRADAQASSRIARSRQDAAESLNASQGDEAAQMRLALDAWQQAHTVEARGALLAAQMTNLVGYLGTGLGGVSAAVSPDGSLIAIGHADGTVWLWDTATLTRRAPPLARANGEDVVSLAFSPDGRYLAAGTFSGAGVRVWDLPSGRLRYTLLGVGAVGWLPGTATLVASRIDDGVRFPVGFWDAATGQRVRSLDTGGVPGFSLRVSADGQYLALSDGRNARVLRVRDGQVVTTLPGIANLAFAPDGSLVGGDLVGHLSQFAVPSGRLLRALTPASDPVGAAHMTVTPDGTLLAPGRAGQALGLWRLDTGTEIGFPGTSVGMAEVAASADGRLLVTTDPAAPSTVYRRATDWLDHPDAVLDVAYDPGGRRLATADVDGTVRLWDAGTRDLVTAFRPASPARGVVYSPDGTLAVITEQNVELRDGAGRLHATLRTDWPPWDIAFSPDGTLLAEGTTANTADLLAGRSEHNVTVVWNVRDQTVRGAPLDTGDYTPFAVAFSRDGRTLLAVLTRAAAIGPNPGVLAALRTWRAADLAPQSSQIVSDRQVRDLAVRPDGRQLAFADDNRRVVALSADGSRVLWRSPAIPSPIDRIAYSPDGRTLASSGRDGAVRLWNTADGSLIAVLTEQSGMVGGLSFAPDGRTLATATVEGLVGLWQLDPAEAVRRVCRIVVPASRTEGVAPPSACG